MNYAQKPEGGSYQPNANGNGIYASPPNGNYASPPNGNYGTPVNGNYAPPANGTVTAQPKGTNPMNVGAGGNRNALNKQYNTKGEREWSHGICGCFGDFGACCLAVWCPCMAYSVNKSRLEYLERNGAPHPDHGAICTGDCAVHGCLTWLGFGWVLQMGTRNDVRKRYSIEGGACGDCCTACWCTPCELTQESREIELEERSIGRH